MPILYADLTRKHLSETVGGGRYSFPALIEGDDLTVGLRFSERVNGQYAEVRRTVSALRVTLSRVDRRPAAGKWKLKFGDPGGPSVENQNLTVEMDAGISAADMLEALKDLTDLTTAYSDFATEGAVELIDGSYLITGLDGDAELTGAGNRLRPSSEIRITGWQRPDESWVWEIRLVENPVAITTLHELQLPGAPAITLVENGGAADDLEWPERQKLSVPAAFRGVFGVERPAQSLQTGPLSFTGDADEDRAILQTALNEFLLTEAEKEESASQFVVTAAADGVIITFAGPSLTGINQPLLEAYVIDHPPGDPTWTLSLKQPELTSLLNAAAALTPAYQIPLQLQIEVELEDEHDEETDRTITLHRQEVIVMRDNARAGQDAGQAINWTHEHRDDYKPVSPGSIITGEQSASDAFGDGVATVFNIDHGLASVNISKVSVIENSEPGDALVHGTDYTWQVVNEDRVKITMLGSYASSPPASDALYYVICAAGPKSVFQDHDHAMEAITGLLDALSTLSARVTVLESLIGQTAGATTAATGSQIEYPLTPVMIALRPTAGLTLEPTPLASLDILGAGLSYRRLAAAVHDTAVENLATTLPAAGSSYVGNAYVATAANSAFPGGGIRVGDFAICDGIRWLRASRYLGPTVAFTADASTDKLTSTAHGLADGDRVMLATTAADLPAPLATGAVYYVVSSATDDFKLATTSGGSAINLTDAGTGTHYWQRVKDSFYPAEMETELFQVHVAPEELTLGSTLSLQFGIEAAIKFDADRRPRDRKTEASCRLLVEAGIVQSVTTPGTPGPNLSGIVWTTLLDSAMRLTPTPMPIRGGVTIVRSTGNVLTATRLIGRSSAAALAPNGGTGGVPFFLRGRIIDFDTNDSTPEPAGLVLIRGLDVGLDGRTDATLGRVTIG